MALVPPAPVVAVVVVWLSMEVTLPALAVVVALLVDAVTLSVGAVPVIFCPATRE